MYIIHLWLSLKVSQPATGVVAGFLMSKISGGDVREG